MRKPDFCIGENKGADQLHGNRTADQGLCFCYIDSTIPLFLNRKFQVCSHLLCVYSTVSVGHRRQVLSKNKKDRFVAMQLVYAMNNKGIDQTAQKQCLLTFLLLEYAKKQFFVV